MRIPFVQVDTPDEQAMIFFHHITDVTYRPHAKESGTSFMTITLVATSRWPANRYDVKDSKEAQRIWDELHIIANGDPNVA